MNHNPERIRAAIRKRLDILTHMIADASLSGYEALKAKDYEAYRYHDARASRLQYAKKRLQRAHGLWLGRALNPHLYAKGEL